MRFFIKLFLLTLLCSHALAQTSNPSYKQARGFYDGLSKPLNEAALWDRKKLPERLKALELARAQHAMAEKIFKNLDGSSCVHAAYHEKMLVIDLNDLVLATEGIKKYTSFMELSSPVFNAFVYGEHKGHCYTYIESLATSTKK